MTTGLEVVVGVEATELVEGVTTWAGVVEEIGAGLPEPVLPEQREEAS